MFRRSSKPVTFMIRAIRHGHKGGLDRETDCATRNQQYATILLRIGLCGVSRSLIDFVNHRFEVLRIAFDGQNDGSLLDAVS
jgi:hypothetical protein